VFDSKALGDTLAHFPYAEEFRKKHNCKMFVSSHWNHLFKEAYPEINFVLPGSKVNNLYAQYLVGCFDNNYNRNKINWREIPLQKVATDILGLDYKEVKAKIIPKLECDLTGNYVCISEFSTLYCKLWNTPNGWKDVISYLDTIGYKVVVISKEKSNLENTIHRTNRSIDETIATLKRAKLFIGVSSGPTWLAWTLGIPTILISGFSNKNAEMSSDVERIINEEVCHGCFNDPSLPFDRGNWKWCPRNRNFECSTKISSKLVIDSINKILKK